MFAQYVNPPTSFAWPPSPRRPARQEGNPRLLTLTGSLELAPDYEKAKEALERATENATFNFTKRRGIAGEIKQYKEQKTEADRFEALCQEKVLHYAFLLCYSF